MIETARRAATAFIACALFAVLAGAVLHLPSYGKSRGPYEQRRAVQAVQTRHATNLDAFVNFDLRGFDTLGEEFIFLVAIGGFSLLLHERREHFAVEPRAAARGRDPREPEPVVQIASLVFLPVTLVYGLYIVIHGQLTPGGGFQGGVVLASAALAVFLGAGFEGYRRVFPKAAVEAFETLGFLGYVALGVAGLVAGGSFLRNVLPLGATGSLLSAGTIDALNVVVGVGISGGFIVLFSEFINQTRAPKGDDEP